MQKRESGEGWMAVGATSAAEESVGWRAIRSSAENARAAAINGGVPIVVGFLQYERFSVEREAAIIKSYNEGWPIPPDIRRKLRRKHFRRTARDLKLTN
jgi:hypothetical protein